METLQISRFLFSKKSTNSNFKIKTNRAPTFSNYGPDRDWQACVAPSLSVWWCGGAVARATQVRRPQAGVARSQSSSASSGATLVVAIYLLEKYPQQPNSSSSSSSNSRRGCAAVSVPASKKKKKKKRRSNKSNNNDKNNNHHSLVPNSLSRRRGVSHLRARGVFVLVCVFRGVCARVFVCSVSVYYAESLEFAAAKGLTSTILGAVSSERCCAR